MPLLMRPSNRYTGYRDPELIAACLAGDTAAWDTLLARYEALIFSLPRRMGLSQADAQDVFQEVCLLLFNHLESLRDTSRLAGWLTSTTKREAWRISRRRNPALASQSLESELALENEAAVTTGDAPTLEANLLALEDQQLVRQALQQLPDRCRNLLTLLYCEDPPRSYADTAEALSLPVGSIGPSRARCLQNLHKLLLSLGF